MESEKTLKYHEGKQFNSERLQQYDNEGQRLFLCFLLRKGYNLEIRDKEIIFKDIALEKKLDEIIELYNNEVVRESINIEKRAVRECRVCGIEEYNQRLDNQLKSLNRKESKIVER